MCDKDAYTVGFANPVGSHLCSLPVAKPPPRMGQNQVRSCIRFSLEPNEYTRLPLLSSLYDEN
jgi:hypothetical protein